MKNWSSLHHQVWKILKPWKDHPFLIAVSGGADSMALLNIAKDLPLKIEVFHAHHGPGDNLEFRNQAEKFVLDFCVQHKISRHFVKSKQKLSSEKEFRDFRKSEIEKWLQVHPQGFVMTAHHAEDLLETRIIRLIRGTGPQGLQSMSVKKGFVIRPFLEISKTELKNYLKSHNLEFIEDPTNQSSRYLRNWLRNRWLPQLEKKRPGSLKRLGASIENLVPEISPSNREYLSRSEYLSLNTKEQLQALAALLKSKGLLNYTQGQLKEIQKRLDNPQRRLTFISAGAEWVINAERISFKRIIN